MNKNNNPFLRFMTENNIAKSMEQYKNNTMDWQTLFEIQRRNTHTWSKAGQVTMDNLQNMAKNQRNILSHIVQDNKVLSEKYTEPTSEDQKESQGETTKKANSL